MLSAVSTLSVPAIETSHSVSIALSGGIDSVVLLHLCLQHYKSGHLKNIKAIHVNHNLSGHAEAWENFCQKLCEQWSVPFFIQHVTLSDRAGIGVERAAREARYQAFKNHLQEGECLLLAHHQDDQAETMLFRALRGGDPYSLSAIPKQRLLGKGFLFRPLLKESRKAIEYYAHTHELSWVEDDSNSQLHYDRNFIRQRIMPVISTRWPHAAKGLAEAASQCQTSQRLLNEIAVKDLQHVAQRITLPLLGETTGLHCTALQKLQEDHQINLLKYWFRSKNLPIPSKHCLYRIITEILTAASDKLPSVNCYGLEVKRYQQWLLLDDMQTYPSIAPTPLELTPGQIPLSTDGSVLNITCSHEEHGISTDLTHIEVLSRPYASNIPAFAIPGRTGRKSLKKWLNEFKVPPWIRDSLPLLVYENQLVAIPGLLTNVRFSAEDGAASWQVKWQLTDHSPRYSSAK